MKLQLGSYVHAVAYVAVGSEAVDAQHARRTLSPVVTEFDGWVVGVARRYVGVTTAANLGERGDWRSEGSLLVYRVTQSLSGPYRDCLGADLTWQAPCPCPEAPPAGLRWPKHTTLHGKPLQLPWKS